MKEAKVYIYFRVLLEVRVQSPKVLHRSRCSTWIRSLESVELVQIEVRDHLASKGMRRERREVRIGQVKGEGDGKNPFLTENQNTKTDAFTGSSFSAGSSQREFY